MPPILPHAGVVGPRASGQVDHSRILPPSLLTLGLAVGGLHLVLSLWSGRVVPRVTPRA